MATFSLSGYDYLASVYDQLDSLEPNYKHNDYISVYRQVFNQLTLNTTFRNVEILSVSIYVVRVFFLFQIIKFANWLEPSGLPLLKSNPTYWQSKKANCNWYASDESSAR